MASCFETGDGIRTEQRYNFQGAACEYIVPFCSDLYDVWKWNAAVPESVEDYVHNVFAQRVAETPEAHPPCAHGIAS